MQFGLLYEVQRPFEGTSVDWNTLYKETLEQCALADKVGFDNLWFVEHHFLTGFSGSPCPEVIFGALSQHHQADPDRLRRLHPAVPPSRPRRRARRHGRPADRWSRRGRHRPLQRLRADRPRRRSRETPAPCGKSRSRCCPRSGSRTSSPGKASSGRCPRAACSPSRSRSRTRAVPRLHPDRQLRRGRRARASACSRRPPSPRTSWPSTSRSTATRVKQCHARRRHHQRRSGATTSTPSAARTTPRRRSWPRCRSRRSSGRTSRTSATASTPTRSCWNPGAACPDHLKADFGRWLRQSDDAHKEQAAAGRHLARHRPRRGAGRLRRDGPDTLRDRGIIIAGDPEHCIKTCQLYEDVGVDQVHADHADRDDPARARCWARSRCSASTSSRCAGQPLAPGPRPPEV